MAQFIDKLNQVPAANIAKINGIVLDADDSPAAGEISKINTLSAYASADIPAGLIVLFTDGGSGAPANWTLWSDADNKHIVGAGDTYAAGDNGAGDGNPTAATNTIGSHTNTTTSAYVYSSGWAGTGTNGNHSHTTTFSYNPPRQDCYLIQADSDQTEFPTDAAVLLEAAHGSLTNIYTNGYMFRAAASVATGGSASASVSSTSSGSHNHGGQSGSYNYFPSMAGKQGRTNAGTHSHTGTGTVTNTLYQYALAAYTDAAASFSCETDMIAMWEGAVAPDGWHLCDGTDGTPDMQNYFVKLVAAASAGSASGNGTITLADSLAHATHNHYNGDSQSSSTETAGHYNSKAMTAHTVNTNKAWVPPYYALTFIIKV